MNQERAWIEVDAQKLEHNLHRLEQSAFPSKIMAVVKDQFYGMGMEAIIHLQDLGVDHFAVATIEEALQLRFTGISKPILILGYTPSHRFLELYQHDLIQSIVSHDLGESLSQFAQQHRLVIKVHIKINTGMNRMGLVADTKHDREQIVRYYNDPNLSVLGTFTHFIASDQYDQIGDDLCRLQISKFNQFLNYLQAKDIKSGVTHVHNSAAVERYGQEFVYDYCRPGLFFAGTNTAEDYQNSFVLKARVVMVKSIEAHSQIGYGYENKVEKATKVATISIGYGDGLRRNLITTGFKPRINGIACPILGRICMDLLMLDVSSIEDIKVGDIVSFIDDQFSLDDIAALLGTIPNEVMTQFTRRVPRVLINK